MAYLIIGALSKSEAETAYHKLTEKFGGHFYAQQAGELWQVATTHIKYWNLTDLTIKLIGHWPINWENKEIGEQRILRLMG